MVNRKRHLVTEEKILIYYYNIRRLLTERFLQWWKQYSRAAYFSKRHYQTYSISGKENREAKGLITVLGERGKKCLERKERGKEL